MKKALYLILSLIALILIYLRLNYSGTNEQLSTKSTNDPTYSSAPTLIPTPQIDLSEKLNNAYFTLSYSPTATTSSSRSPDSQEWVISYIGEEQKKSGRTQTELWDGFAITITRFEAIGEDPKRIQAEADRRGIIEACSEKNTTPITDGKVGRYETITFYGGCLGEGEYHYLMMADTLYRITFMTVGNESYKEQYRDLVLAILGTLNFK